MRTAAAIAAGMLMCALSASAQEAKTQFSIFTGNIGYSQSAQNGSSVSGDIGVALSYVWTSHWSTELAVTATRGRAYATTFIPYGNAGNIAPVYGTHDFAAFPVDLTAHYRFTNNSRWTPYVSGGVRYVARPSDPASIIPSSNPLSPYAPVTPGFGFRARTSAEIGIGTGIRLSPHFGLRLDGMRLLRSDAAPYDRLMRASAGVSFHF
jgi:hypothetical protein